MEKMKTSNEVKSFARTLRKFGRDRNFRKIVSGKEISGLNKDLKKMEK